MDTNLTTTWRNGLVNNNTSTSIVSKNLVIYLIDTQPTVMISAWRSIYPASMVTSILKTSLTRSQLLKTSLIVWIFQRTSGWNTLLIDFEVVPLRGRNSYRLVDAVKGNAQLAFGLECGSSCTIDSFRQTTINISTTSTKTISNLIVLLLNILKNFIV